jgi:hypothetical protein
MLPGWHSDPQYQQAIGRRPTPKTAQPLGSTLHKILFFKTSILETLMDRAVLGTHCGLLNDDKVCYGW